MPNIGYLPPGSEIVESPLGPAGQIGGIGAAGGAGGGTGGGGLTSVTNLDLTTITNVVTPSPSTAPIYFADNPKYGIKGDGVTNDSPALQALVNNIVGGTPPGTGILSGIIVFGAKTYLLATAVNLPQGISLWGCSVRALGVGTQTPGGLNQTIFKCLRLDNAPTFSDSGCNIQDISFITSGPQNGNYPVYSPSGSGTVATVFTRCTFTVDSGTSPGQTFFQIPDISALHFVDCMFWDPNSANQLYNIRSAGGGGFLNFTNCLIGITPTGTSKAFQFEGALDATNYNLRFTNCTINIPNNYPSKGYAQINYNSRTNSRIRVQFIGCRILLNGYNSFPQYRANTTGGDAVVSFLGCDVNGANQAAPFFENKGLGSASAVFAFGNKFSNFATGTPFDILSSPSDGTNIYGMCKGNAGLTGTDIAVSSSTSPVTINSPFNSSDSIAFLTSGAVLTATMTVSGTPYPINTTGPWYLPAGGQITLSFTGSITVHFKIL